MGEFKVGDRVVRRNYLGKGDCYGTVAEKVGGLICAEDWTIGRPCGELHEDHLELVTPALTIESGKFYKTRDGQKVGPMEAYTNDSWQEPKGRRLWISSGERFFEIDRGGPTDIIAEWTDTTADKPKGCAAAQVDTLADEYGAGADFAKEDKPKFKVGDSVVINYGHGWDGPATVTAVCKSDIIAMCANGEEGCFAFRYVKHARAPTTVSELAARLVEIERRLWRIEAHTRHSYSAHPNYSARYA